MQITFDTNVWNRMVFPESWSEEPNFAALQMLREAVRTGVLEGLICESFATSEAIHKHNRAKYYVESVPNALLANQGWLASEKLIQSTIANCVGDQVCQQVNQLAERARTMPHSISAYKQGQSENYDIAQYSAKSLELLDDKIAQFPKGSQFSLIKSSPQIEEQKKLEDSVQSMLEKRGMILEHN